MSAPLRLTHQLELGRLRELGGRLHHKLVVALGVRILRIYNHVCDGLPAPRPEWKDTTSRERRAFPSSLGPATQALPGEGLRPEPPPEPPHRGPARGRADGWPRGGAPPPQGAEPGQGAGPEVRASAGPLPPSRMPPATASSLLLLGAQGKEPDRSHSQNLMAPSPPGLCPLPAPASPVPPSRGSPHPQAASSQTQRL